MPGTNFRTGSDWRRCSSCFCQVIPLVEWDTRQGSRCLCNKCIHEEPFKSDPEIRQFLDEKHSDEISHTALVNSLKKKPISTEDVEQMILVILHRAPASRQELQDGVREIRKKITIAAIDRAINTLEREGKITLQPNRFFCIAENL